MHLPAGLLDFQNAYQLSTAVFIVVFVTQTVQLLTGWNPAWVGALVSLLTAMLGVAEQMPLPWYGAILQVFIRACQLFCMAGGAVGFITKGLQQYRIIRGLTTSKQQVTDVDVGLTKETCLARTFWKLWY